MSQPRRWYHQLAKVCAARPTNPQHLAELEELQQMQRHLYAESQLDTPYVVWW